jgi:hypothetical protein
MAFPTRHRSSVARIGAGFKDRFNRLPEEARDADGERKAGIILPGFDCAHDLTCDMEPRSKIRLRPLTLCSETSEPVPHSR